MMRLMRAVGNLVFTGEGSMAGAGAACAAAPRFGGMPPAICAAAKEEEEEESPSAWPGRGAEFAGPVP